jgi:hypothetical protein
MGNAGGLQPVSIFLQLLKWLRNIPVLFAHFPGPSILLVLIAIGCASTASAWVTHKFEAGARASLRAEVAEMKAAYADERTAAANGRADTIKSAAAQQAAINAATIQFMTEAMRAYVDAKGAAAPALAALGKQIEELHRDAKYACRREPLPGPYVDGLRIPAGPVPAAAAVPAGSH